MTNDVKEEVLTWALGFLLSATDNKQSRPMIMSDLNDAIQTVEKITLEDLENLLEERECL